MSDPADTAVIQILMDRLGSGYTKHSDPGVTEDALKAHEAQIEKVRAWAMTLSGPDRRRYLKWLDVWQRGVDEYRHERDTGSDKKKWDAISARIKAEDEQAAIIKQTLPRPPK